VGGQAPLRQHVTKIAGMALESHECAITPRYEISYVKMIVTDLNAYFCVRWKSGNLFQQIVSRHLE
jgi:hypothetical protein